MQPCGRNPSEQRTSRILSALPAIERVAGKAPRARQSQSAQTSPKRISQRPITVRMADSHEARHTTRFAARPANLAFRFIDQQELRHPSGSELRKVVRSHARRDVDVKKKNFRAGLKARSPRLLLDKGAWNRTADGGSVSNRSTVLTTCKSLSASEIVVQPLVVSEAPRLLSLSMPSGVYISSHSLVHSQSRLCVPRSNDQDRYRLITSTSTYTRVIEASDVKDYKSKSLSSEGTPKFEALISGSWQQDPFDIYEEVNNPRVSYLLSEYSSMLKGVWVSSKHLMSFQTSRPGLLHATLLFTASYLKATSGCHRYDNDILHHRGETIRILNESLDNPKEQTSDQIIAVLSSLILFEESYGSADIAMIHRQGLRQVLRLRDTRPNLGIHSFVQDLLVHPLRSLNTEFQAWTSNASSASDHRCRSTPLGRSVTSTFLWLTNTAIKHESVSYKTESIFEVWQDIEEFLELCPNYDKSSLSFGFRSWLLAALVHLHVTIVPHSSIGLLPRTEAEIVSQLKHAMYSSPMTDKKLSCSPRLWALMMNALHSRSNDSVLLGSPRNLDMTTVSLLHWCRAQLLLRDIPWAERRWKFEDLEKDDCWD